METFSFGIAKEKSLTTGEGLGRVPAKPESPGGVDNPKPVISRRRILIPSASSCLAAIFATTSLDPSIKLCSPY